MKEKCLRPLLAVFVLLFAGMLAWNISLQREVEKYKPQVEAYLPEDVYEAAEIEPTSQYALDYLSSGSPSIYRSF